MEEEEEMAGAVGKEEMAGATGKEEMAEATGKDEIAEAVGKEEIAWATVKEEKENQDEEKDTKLAGAHCCDSRWRVSYISHLISRKKRAHKGSMLLRAVANRIVLYDNTETQIDRRNLNVGELIYPGSILDFPCYKVDVGEYIFQPDACIKNEDVLAPILVTRPQQLSGAVEQQLPSNEDKENGEGHLLVNAGDLGVDKENGKKRMNKKDEKREKRRKLQEEQEMRDEKKRKLDEEQEMRDVKKRKRLKAAAGIRLVRSPVAMIAKVVSRKQMSPQANLSGSGQKPRKLKSIVWKEVIPIYKHGRLVQGQCKHCNDTFAASRKSGTNHIHRHLRICKTRTRMHDLVAKLSASASSPQASDLDKWEFNQDKSALMMMRRKSVRFLSQCQ